MLRILQVEQGGEGQDLFEIGVLGIEVTALGRVLDEQGVKMLKIINHPLITVKRGKWVGARRGIVKGIVKRKCTVNRNRSSIHLMASCPGNPINHTG